MRPVILNEMVLSLRSTSEMKDLILYSGLADRGKRSTDEVKINDLMYMIPDTHSIIGQNVYELINLSI